MQTDHFEHTTGLIDILVAEPSTRNEAEAAIRELTTQVLTDRTDDPMVTVYVDRPADEPDLTRHEFETALNGLSSEFDIMHFVVRVDDRPLLGHPLTEGDDGPEPGVQALRRACARVASALMHADDVPMADRIQAAAACNAATHQVGAVEDAVWAAQQLGGTAWGLGDHPIPRAAKQFEQAIEPTDDDDAVDADTLLASCVALAEALCAGDGAIEAALQATDARIRSLRFPSAAAVPTTSAQFLGVASSLAARVESAFVQEAEHGFDDYTDDLFVPRETDALQYIGNFPVRLRAAVSPLERSHHAFVAASRVSLAFDALALTAMTVDPADVDEPITHTLLRSALDYALRESCVAHGMMDANSTDAPPLDLPYWPFVMHRADNTDVTVDLTVLNTIVQHASELASSGDVPADLLDVVQGWRAHLAELKGNPTAADQAALADGLIDAILLKFAIRAGEEDTTRFMTLARQGTLSSDPAAIAAVKRLATSDSATDGAATDDRASNAAPSDAAKTALGLAVTLLGNQLAYLKESGEAGMPGTLTIKDGQAHMGYLAADNSADALRMFEAGLNKGETAAACAMDTYLRKGVDGERFDAIIAAGATPGGIIVRIAVPYTTSGGTVAFPEQVQLLQADAGLALESVREVVFPKMGEFGLTELREDFVTRVADDVMKEAAASLFERLLNMAGDRQPADLSMCDPETVETARNGAVAGFWEVAAADGNVDESEVKTFLIGLRDAKQPLIRTLFPLEVEAFQSQLNQVRKYTDRLAALKALGEVFDTHPDGAAARSELKSLLRSIAMADGSIDAAEQRTLDKVDDMLSGQALTDFLAFRRRFFIVVGVALVLILGSLIGCGAWLVS